MPKAPPTRCTHKGCGRFATNKSRCDEHQPTGWHEYRRTHGTNTTSQRLGTSQSNWNQLRANTMSRHNGICYWCGQPGANHVDHIQAVGLGGAKTDPDNLAPIHSEPCHREKTAQELTEMRKRKNGGGNPYFFPTRKNQKPQKPFSRAKKGNTNPGSVQSDSPAESNLTGVGESYSGYSGLLLRRGSKITRAREMGTPH